MGASCLPHSHQRVGIYVFLFKLVLVLRHLEWAPSLLHDLAAMPAARSYHSAAATAVLLSAAQCRRRDRDWWYRACHSAPGKKFVERDRGLAPSVKAMVRGKLIH